MLAEFATDLYRPASVAFLTDALRQVAEAIAAEPEVRRSQLPVAAWEERPRERRLQLSYAQQRMFFLSRWDQSSPLYNVPFATRWRGAFDLELFARALLELCRRHEVLRCRYVADADGAPQPALDPPGPPPIELLELGGAEPAEREERLAAELARLARQPFDLAREWPLHVTVLRLGRALTDGRCRPSSTTSLSTAGPSRSSCASWAPAGACKPAATPGRPVWRACPANMPTMQSGSAASSKAKAARRRKPAR